MRPSFSVTILALSVLEASSVFLASTWFSMTCLLERSTTALSRRRFSSACMALVLAVRAVVAVHVLWAVRAVHTVHVERVERVVRVELVELLMVLLLVVATTVVVVAGV